MPAVLSKLPSLLAALPSTAELSVAPMSVAPHTPVAPIPVLVRPKGYARKSWRRVLKAFKQTGVWYGPLDAAPVVAAALPASVAPSPAVSSSVASSPAVTSSSPAVSSSVASSPAATSSVASSPAVTVASKRLRRGICHRPLPCLYPFVIGEESFDFDSFSTFSPNPYYTLFAPLPPNWEKGSRYKRSGEQLVYFALFLKDPGSGRMYREKVQLEDPRPQQDPYFPLSVASPLAVTSSSVAPSPAVPLSVASSLAVTSSSVATSPAVSSFVAPSLWPSSDDVPHSVSRRLTKSMAIACRSRAFSHCLARKFELDRNAFIQLRKKERKLATDRHQRLNFDTIQLKSLVMCQIQRRGIDAGIDPSVGIASSPSVSPVVLTATDEVTAAATAVAVEDPVGITPLHRPCGDTHSSFVSPSQSIDCDLSPTSTPRPAASETSVVVVDAHTSENHQISSSPYNPPVEIPKQTVGISCSKPHHGNSDVSFDADRQQSQLLCQIQGRGIDAGIDLPVGFVSASSSPSPLGGLEIELVVPTATDVVTAAAAVDDPVGIAPLHRPGGGTHSSPSVPCSQSIVQFTFDCDQFPVVNFNASINSLGENSLLCHCYVKGKLGKPLRDKRIAGKFYGQWTGQTFSRHRIAV